MTDRERQSMGLSRSAFFEVLLRFWLRDQQAIARDRAAPGVGSEVKAGRTRRSRVFRTDSSPLSAVSPAY